MKKSYQVFYVIKQNGREYQYHMSVMADNQREAIKQCKTVVFEKTGRNAFRETTKAPCKRTNDGVSQIHACPEHGAKPLSSRKAAKHDAKGGESYGYRSIQYSAYYGRKGLEAEVRSRKVRIYGAGV